MKNVHWVDLGPWPPALAIVDDKRTFNRLIRAKTAQPPERPFPGSGGGLCIRLDNERGAALFVIAIGPQGSRDELAVTLAHEATHAMRWILEYVGENEPGTEAQCYLVEHIVRRGLEAL